MDEDPFHDTDFGEGVFAGDLDDEPLNLQDFVADDAFGQGALGPHDFYKGAFVAEEEQDEDEIGPMARKIKTLEMNKANRDADTDEQRALAIQLRATPTPIEESHARHKSKYKESCISCAKMINALYNKFGSNVYFAMADPRWPMYICKHLKPDVRCKECYGVSLCEHNTEKFRCKVCGNAYCRDPTHTKGKTGALLRKSACPECIEKRKSKMAIAEGGAKRLTKRRKYSVKRRRSFRQKKKKTLSKKK